MTVARFDESHAVASIHRSPDLAFLFVIPTRRETGPNDNRTHL